MLNEHHFWHHVMGQNDQWFCRVQWYETVISITLSTGQLLMSRGSVSWKMLTVNENKDTWSGGCKKCRYCEWVMVEKVVAVEMSVALDVSCLRCQLLVCFAHRFLRTGHVTTWILWRHLFNSKHFKRFNRLKQCALACGIVSSSSSITCGVCSWTSTSTWGGLTDLTMTPVVCWRVSNSKSFNTKSSSTMLRNTTKRWLIGFHQATWETILTEHQSNQWREELKKETAVERYWED